MKKMVFSYFNMYEQVESGAEAQTNQYENMGEQALLNEMDAHFGQDKNTYGKLQRTTGYRNFFTAVMNKLMANDQNYPKDGAFADKVGHYQNTYMDIHQQGGPNFKTAADRKLGPTTRDYMKGWLQAIVDQSNNAAPTAPVIPKPVYNSVDTAGVSAIKVDSLPKSGSVDLAALKGVSMEGKLNQLGISRDLYDRAKGQDYLTDNGEFDLFWSNPYNTTADRKGIVVNFANKQKITVPLASIVDKVSTGDVMMDETFKFSGANFTRAVFAELPKKITEATDKTIGVYQTTFDTAHDACMGILKGNKGRDDKINAINSAIGVLQPIQWKVYDITQKQGPNTYYDGTLAEQTSNQMFRKVEGLKSQLDAHTTGKAFFDYWYSDVFTTALDEDEDEYKTTHFDLLQGMVDKLDISNPDIDALEAIRAQTAKLTTVYQQLQPKYDAYATALSQANPKATIDSAFNPARFAAVLESSTGKYATGAEVVRSRAANL